MAVKITDRIAALDARSTFFSLEFFPPKTAAGFQNLVPRLTRLAHVSPLFVCVTFNAGGTTASKSLELADFCQNQLSLTTCLHLTCTNVAVELIDWVLIEAKRIGIRNILALRGDEPRRREYGETTLPEAVKDNSNGDRGEQFNHAVDLIKHIRRTHGDFFCIGAAAYPEGHPIPSPEHTGGVQQSPEADLPHLVEKVKAGADFLITQLFYDAGYYNRFEDMLHRHPDGVFDDIPVIPGLMPVQGWQSFSRTCKLARVSVPEGIRSKLQAVKGDDSAVKALGTDILGDIIDRIREYLPANRSDSGSDVHANGSNGRVEGERRESKVARGFHFYTLNLEKAVALVLERCNLTGPHASESITHHPSKTNDILPLHLLQQNGDYRDSNTLAKSALQIPPTSNPDNPSPWSNTNIITSPASTSASASTGENHRRFRRASSSSMTKKNRVVVDRESSRDRPSSRTFSPSFEAYSDEFGIDPPPSSAVLDGDDDVLSISEGEGYAGREATWDDYPNGRWGDARSPAYGSINNYALHPQLSPTSALALWGRPTSLQDVTTIFNKYLTGAISANPWSEEALSGETKLIEKQLLALNSKGWWTVASQPAVNAAKSSDETVGWGPRYGGFVWQKPFVEMFVPATAWTRLRRKLDALPDDVAYFAGNANADFVSSSSLSDPSVASNGVSGGKAEATGNKRKDGKEQSTTVYPVTWGSFKGKEIITPTIIEPVSFRAWQDEAFNIWREWERVFAPSSPSANLLSRLANEVWLVNVIGHDFMDGERLWRILLEE